MPHPNKISGCTTVILPYLASSVVLNAIWAFLLANNYFNLRRWGCCLNYYSTVGYCRQNAGKSYKSTRREWHCKLANLSQSRELHWTVTLFRQRSMIGSNNAQRISIIASFTTSPSEKPFFFWIKNCVALNEASVAFWEFLSGLVKKGCSLHKAAYSRAFSARSALPGG